MKKSISLVTLIVLLLSVMVGANAAAVTTDREGNPITLPETIERIACFGPSNTEILCAMGVTDKLVAVDTYSFNVEGIAADLPMFDMMAPDAEKILALNPDVLFVTGMSKVGGDDPYKPMKDAGVCVIYMPSSSSLNGIKEDIAYIASVVGETEKGDEVVAKMEDDIAAIKAIADTAPETKTIYFEISAAPYMYSFGSGVFLNEMIELINCVNIFADKAEFSGWISVTDEVVLGANPDVIMTSVNYLPDAVGEIKGRPGWDALEAVKNDQVFYIDTDSSNRPSQNIIKAFLEMAQAVYPELYQDVDLQKAS